MGKRAPSFVAVIPSVNNAFAQPTAASPAFPNGADAVQHAVATGGRHFGMTVGVYIADGTTITIPVPVPPSVVYMRVSFILIGDGAISIDSTNNGTAKAFENATVMASAFDDGACFFSTSSIPGDLATSPLKVRSSAAWTWTAEAVTIAFTSSSVTSNDGRIHGVCFQPVWQPETV